MVGDPPHEELFDFYKRVLGEIISFVNYLFEVFEQFATSQDGCKLLVVDSAIVENNPVYELIKKFESFRQSSAVADGKSIALETERLPVNMLQYRQEQICIPRHFLKILVLRVTFVFLLR